MTHSIAQAQFFHWSKGKGADETVKLQNVAEEMLLKISMYFQFKKVKRNGKARFSSNYKTFR